MYGQDILCRISKGTFEIRYPHKISYPYIERDDFFQYWKFKNSQIYKLISVFETPPQQTLVTNTQIASFAGMAFAHQVYFTSHMRPPLMFNFIMIDYLLVYAL